MNEANFSTELWTGEGGMRAWFIHLIADAVKTLSILAALYIFWEVISLLRFRHYPEIYLQALEKAHFAFMFCTLLVTGLNFVFKQVIVLWQNKKHA